MAQYATWPVKSGSGVTPLPNDKIFVGNAANMATAVAVSGDLTLVNTGAFTVAKIQGTIISGTTGSVNVVFSSAPTIKNPTLQDPTDATKQFSWDLSGQTTGTRLTLSPVNTSNMVLNIPQVATATGAGMALVQDETTGFIFGYGITSSLGASNSMFQLANATVANRAQIKLHSYINANSIAGVSTLTSRSGVIGTNAAVVNGQDYSAWTAQACATTAGTAPISGKWVFRATTVNSTTVTSNFAIQLTNIAGTLGDRFNLTSEGALTILGALNVSTNQIHNVVNPTSAQDAATKNYVDTPIAEFSIASSATPTADFSNGPAQAITLTSSATFTFSNGQSGGSYLIRIVQGGAGSFTITWPGSVKWPGGTAPTLTTTVGAVDIVGFYFDGTNYNGSSGLNFS